MLGSPVIHRRPRFGNPNCAATLARFRPSAANAAPACRSVVLLGIVNPTLELKQILAHSTPVRDDYRR